LPRVNVWIPEGLYEQVRERLPGVNVSRVVQEALAARLVCGHERLVCSDCGSAQHRVRLAEEALAGFYEEVWYELASLARRDGTAVGAVAVVKRLGERAGIRQARLLGAARPSRAERHQVIDAKLADLPGRRRRKVA
jgi:hypothetical protein